MENQIDLPSGGPHKIGPNVARLLLAQLRFVCTEAGSPAELAALAMRNAAKKAMTADDWRWIRYICSVIVGWAP